MQIQSLPNTEQASKGDGRLVEEVVNKSELVELRAEIEADRPFIFSTWLRGLRHANDHYELIDNEAYFKHQHALIETILDDFGTTIRIACLKEDPSVILGYSVSKDNTLHWVFVKRSWRRIGLGKDLVPKDITTVSHVTKVGRDLLRKNPGIKFNPYLT